MHYKLVHHRSASLELVEAFFSLIGQSFLVCQLIFVNNQLVLLQITQLAKRVSTEFTGVWLQSSMAFEVILDVAGLSELLSTTIEEALVVQV